MRCRVELDENETFRPTKDLKETLLHEMIHAEHFLSRIPDNGISGHGDRFKEKMNFINNATFPDPERPPGGYNVNIHHGFHDEVDYHRQHWWACVKCRLIIKRSINRPPQEADCPYGYAEFDPTCKCSHHNHERNCGGHFEKIREPDGYDKKEFDKGQRLISDFMKPPKNGKEGKSRSKPKKSKKSGAKEKAEETGFFSGKPRFLGEVPKSYIPGVPLNFPALRPSQLPQHLHDLASDNHVGSSNMCDCGKAQDSPATTGGNQVLGKRKRKIGQEDGGGDGDCDGLDQKDKLAKPTKISDDVNGMPSSGLAPKMSSSRGKKRKANVEVIDLTD